MWGPEPYGVRRLVALVEGLPPDGAVVRAIDPKGWNWGWQEEFLASLVEFYVRAHFSSPKGKPPHIRRPWESDEAPGRPARRQSTPNEIKRFAAVKVERKS